MSLTKRKSLTPRQLAANRRNARLSHGAVTASGRRRAATANFRHGFYSRDFAGLMPALGENPAEYNRFLDALVDTWNPANAFEMALVERLARTLWRMNRNDHVQEALALEKVKERCENLKANTFTVFQYVSEKLPALKTLAASAARQDFATRTEDLKLCLDMGGDEPTPAEIQVFGLLQRLRSPGPVDPEMAPWMRPGTESRLAAEGEERAEALSELQKTLAELIEVCERAKEARKLNEQVSPHKVYAMLAPQDPRVSLLLKMEDSSMRQVWLTTNLLLKSRRARVGFEDEGSVGEESK